MLRYRTPILALALSCIATPAFAQTTLRYKFKDGEKLNYVMEQKMKMSMNVMDKAIDTTMNQEAHMAWHVMSVDSDGKATVNIKFGRVKMTMDSPAGKVEVDSDQGNEPDDAIGKVLHGVIKAMSSMEITGKFSPLGELTDVQMPEKTLKKLQEIPGIAAMGDLFSADGLKRMMGQSGLVVPKDAVEKGSKWNHKMDMKLPFGKIGVDLGYVYDGPVTKEGQTLEKIMLKPKMTIEADPKAQFTMKLKSQDNGGQALFDNTTGRIVNVTMSQTMDMDLEIMGQTISQKIIQTVVTRLVDKK